MARRFPNLVRLLLMVLAPLLTACGGDMDVLLEVAQSPCFAGQAKFHSLSVLVAVERPTDSGGPQLVAVSRECVDPTGPLPLLPQGLKLAFAQRGFVATGVTAKEPTWIAMVPHPRDLCDGSMGLCTISDAIPPHGDQDRVQLGSHCLAPNQKNPLWWRCIELVQTTP